MALHIPKSCAHIPASAASRLTSRPPQKDGSCAGQPGDFPVGDSCGSEPNKSQFAHTQSPQKSTTTAYFFSLGPVKRVRRPRSTRRSTSPKPSAGWSQVYDPGRADKQVAQQLKETTQEEQNDGEYKNTQTTADAKVVGPKNANDGAGARMMIFSEGANARCAPPLLLLRLYGAWAEGKK